MLEFSVKLRLDPSPNTRFCVIITKVNIIFQAKAQSEVLDM